MTCISLRGVADGGGGGVARVRTPTLSKTVGVDPRRNVDISVSFFS